MSGFSLKLLGIIIMIIDHIGVMFFVDNPIYRYIGRLAFPIYAFLISIGCRHTKNLSKYLIRLFILAIFSELVYDLAFVNERLYNFPLNYFNDTNVIFTLFFGALIIYVYNCIINFKIHKFLGFLLIAIIIIFGELTRCDYNYLGILLVVLFYICKSKVSIFIFGSLWVLYKYIYVVIGLISYYFGLQNDYLFLYLNETNVLLFLFTLLSIPIILMYNNREGKKIKLIFYLSYPLHIAILILIKMFVN